MVIYGLPLLSSTLTLKVVNDDTSTLEPQSK
jgi:hypothetical protein